MSYQRELIIIVMIQILRPVTQELMNTSYTGIYLWIMNLRDRVDDFRKTLMMIKYPHFDITFQEA